LAIRDSTRHKGDRHGTANVNEREFLLKDILSFFLFCVKKVGIHKTQKAQANLVSVSPTFIGQAMVLTMVKFILGMKFLILTGDALY